RVEVFDEEMRRKTRAKVSLEQDLRTAVREQDLRLYYQPIVSLASGRPVSMEALARWRHPERGEVPPADFIPLAEETGIIGQLGAHTLREACAQMVRWR